MAEIVTSGTIEAPIDTAALTVTAPIDNTSKTLYTRVVGSGTSAAGGGEKIHPSG